MTKPRLVGALLALPLLLTGLPAETATIRGQVLSISRAECHNPGPCEGSVTLWNSGTKKTVRVGSDTKIVRAGKPIHFAELGVGNTVTLTRHAEVEYEPAGRGLQRIWDLEAP